MRSRSEFCNYPPSAQYDIDKDNNLESNTSIDKVASEIVTHSDHVTLKIRNHVTHILLICYTSLT